MKEPADVAWNQENEALHFCKHGIAFKDAALVFADPKRLEMHRRSLRLWRKAPNRVRQIDLLCVAVVFTMHADDLAWIISARRASRKERASYATHSSL